MPRPLLRRSLGWLLLCACAFAPQARAVVVPFTGTMKVEIGSVVTTFSGGGFATVNGSGPGGHVASLSLPAGAIATNGLSVAVTDPSVAPIEGLRISAANGAGTFAETAMGRLGGAVPLQGISKVCLFGPCTNAVANLDIPLSVIGAGGRNVATGYLDVTVEGAPWTTGTAVLFTPFGAGFETRMGFARGPLSMDGTTTAPGGSIQLVTPITVWTNVGVDQPSIFGFVTATLQFVPEPTSLALSAVGCALLGWRAHRRRARR